MTVSAINFSFENPLILNDTLQSQDSKGLNQNENVDLTEEEIPFKKLFDETYLNLALKPDLETGQETLTVMKSIIQDEDDKENDVENLNLINFFQPVIDNKNRDSPENQFLYKISEKKIESQTHFLDGFHSKNKQLEQNIKIEPNSSLEIKESFQEDLIKSLKTSHSLDHETLEGQLKTFLAKMKNKPELISNGNSNSQEEKLIEKLIINEFIPKINYNNKNILENIYSGIDDFEMIEKSNVVQNPFSLKLATPQKPLFKSFKRVNDFISKELIELTKNEKINNKSFVIENKTEINIIEGINTIDSVNNTNQDIKKEFKDEDEDIDFKENNIHLNKSKIDNQLDLKQEVKENVSDLIKRSLLDLVAEIHDPVSSMESANVNIKTDNGVDIKLQLKMDSNKNIFIKIQTTDSDVKDSLDAKKDEIKELLFKKNFVLKELLVTEKIFVVNEVKENNFTNNFSNENNNSQLFNHGNHRNHENRDNQNKNETHFFIENKKIFNIKFNKARKKLSDLDVQRYGKSINLRA